MASGARKTNSATLDPVRGPAPRPTGRVVEYQTYIDGQLKKTRSRVKWVDFWTSATTLGIGVLAYLLVAALIDHWIVPGGLGFYGRVILLVGLLAGIGVHLALNFLPHLLKRVNPVYAAAAIERAGPMKNTLVNFLLLRRQPDAVPEGLLEAMKEQAAVRLSAVPGDAPVDRSALIRWGYVLVAVLLAAVAYALAAPKDALHSVGRVIAPWADLAAPTRVTLEDLTPGNVDKRRDDVVEIKLRTRGMRSGDTATVFYSATGLPEDDVAVTMAGDDQMHWAATIPSAGEGLKQDVFYYVQAGDTKSPQYRVRVLATPVIGTSSVRYEYPAYTGLPPRTVEGQGDLKALEGTTVVLTADANQSMASAFVAFDQARNKDVELNIDKTRRRAIGSFPLLLTKDRQKPLHGSYVLRFTNIDGQENPKPVEHRIEVVPDQAPELKVAEPTTPAEQPIQVPLAGSLRISFSAQDVDFQLAQLSVVYEKFGAEVREETSLIEPRSGPFSNTFLFTPQALGLKAGDRVTFRGRAKDNRTPEPNVTESARYTIVIGGGAADPNQQQQPQQGNPQQQPNQQQNPNQQQGQPPERGQQNPEQQPQQGQPQNGQPQNGQQGQGQQQPGQQGQGQQGQGQQQPGDPQQGQSQPQNGQQQPGQQQSGQQQQKPGMQGDQRSGEQRGDQQSGQQQAGQQQNGQGQSQSGDRQNGQQQQGDQKQNGSPEQQAGNQQQGNRQGSREDEKPLDQNDPGRIFEELKKHYDKQAGNQQQPGDQKSGDQKPDNQQASARDQQQQQPGSQQQQQRGQDQQPGQQQSGQQQQGQQQQPGDGQNSEMRKPGEERAGDGQQNQPNGASQDKHGRDQEPADQKSGAGQRPDQQPKGDEAGSGKRGGSGGGQDAGGQSKQEQPEQSGGSGGKGTNQQQPSDQQNGTQGGTNEAMQRQDGAGSGANEQRPGENNGQGREVSRKPSEGGNAAEQGKQAATGDKPGNLEGARPTDKPAAGDNPSGNKAEGPQPGGNSPQQDMQQPGGEQRNGAQPNSGNPTPNQQGKQTQQGNSGATGGTAPNKDDKRPEQRPGEQGPTADGNAKPSANAQQPAGGDRSGGAKGNSNNEGSPEQQEMSKPRDPGGAASSQNQQESGQGNEAKSPSGSRSESDARGDSSGDRNGKGEQGGGQKSNQKGTGAAGSNTAGDQGAGAAQEQGDSATGNQAGDKVRGKQPSGGEASGEKGAGSNTRAGGNEAGGQSESANTGGDRQGDRQGDPSNRNPQNMEQGGRPGGANSGGGGTPEGDFNPQPRQAPEPGGDEANLEYTKKVTDLTLDKLKNDVEKGTVDPELLKKFGSKEAMEQFVRRWDEMRKAAQQQGPQADAAQKQYQDTLKGLGLRPRMTEQQGATAGDDDSRQLRGARRSAPPAKYADQYRAYTTGIGQGEQK
jgi:hypothetical protein